MRNGPRPSLPVITLAALLPLAAALLGATPAGATSVCPVSASSGPYSYQYCFGEALDAFTSGSLGDALDAEDDFKTLLGSYVTEDFSAFQSGDEASLSLAFGTLSDPTGEGFVSTRATAQEGFPTSARTQWKNTTEEGEGLFTLSFDAPVQAFGFYATAYSTLAATGSTQLLLRLALAGGGTLDIPIPHTTTDSDGKAFYFGVIADPFVAATVLNVGCGEGDVIGFDDMTVPEPATALLLAGGLAALAVARRPRRSR